MLSSDTDSGTMLILHGKCLILDLEMEKLAISSKYGYGRRFQRLGAALDNI